MRKNDDICSAGKCPNLKICRGLCPPLQWIDGNEQGKEKLFSDISKKSTEIISENYNIVLSELINDREIDFDKITAISNYLNRAIAAMLYVSIPKQVVASLLSIPRRSFFRLISGR